MQPISKIIVSKLIVEGVTPLNYTTESVIKILDNCVMNTRMQKHFVENEQEIKEDLEMQFGAFWEIQIKHGDLVKAFEWGFSEGEHYALDRLQKRNYILNKSI